MSKKTDQLIEEKIAENKAYRKMLYKACPVILILALICFSSRWSFIGSLLLILDALLVVTWFVAPIDYEKVKAEILKEEAEEKAEKKAAEAAEKQAKQAAEQKKESINILLENKFKGLDELELEINGLSEMEGVEIHDFKTFIQGLESDIVGKGEDKILFEFLKVASFLQDSVDVFEQKWSSLANSLDFPSVKNALRRAKERELQGGIEVIQEQLDMRMEVMEGKRSFTTAKTKAEAAVLKLLDLRGKLVLDYERDVKNILFYKSMAYSMCAFYMEDKKIMYFEIHEAFEKMGAFDSTWQKNTSTQLKGISDKLDLIGAGLISLHESFTQLNEKQDDIIKGIESVQGAVSGVAALSAIQVYQNYKLNKNIKALGK